MDMQEQFIGMIQDVVALAKINQRRVTKEFLQDFLKEMELTEEQMSFVYQYLQKENIQVEGYQKTAPTQKLNDTISVGEETEESEFLSMYIEEMKSTGSRNQIESSYFVQAAAGDDAAKKHIVEQKLARVVELAGKYKAQGIAQNDLIQEGNIGLLLAVEQLAEHEKDADAFLDEEIERSILSALDEYRDERRENRGLMKKAENLKEEMERLSEDLGDKMTSDDVAQFTGMDLDEIQTILGMTGEDV